MFVIALAIIFWPFSPSMALALSPDAFEKVFLSAVSQTCRPGDEKQFENLNLRFKQQGHYVPVVAGQDSILGLNWMIKQLKLKLLWLKEKQHQLERVKWWNALEFDLDRLQTLLLALQKIRYQLEVDRELEIDPVTGRMVFSSEQQELWLRPWKKTKKYSVYRRWLQQQSYHLLVKDREWMKQSGALQKDMWTKLGEAVQLSYQFKALWKTTLEHIFYLKNFRFPVDHLEQRISFERRQLEWNKSLATGKPNYQLEYQKNKAYLKRKLVEEGAPTSDGQGSDLFLRTSLDHFQTRLMSQGIFWSEDLIFDWEWLAPRLIKIHGQGKNIWLQRWRQWILKNQQLLASHEQLYQKALTLKRDIVKSTAKKKPLLPVPTSSTLAQDSLLLQQFVQERLQAVYQWWSQRSLEEQQLFVMAMILTHEVGASDPNKIYRQRVLDVVWERSQHQTYTRLPPGDSFAAMSNQGPWLNLLFKKGEFSFTYFFIPSVREIFCPPLSGESKKLFLENVGLAVQYLAERNAAPADPKAKAPPIRYFSRVSMTGRIDISSWWEEQEQLVKLDQWQGPQVESDEQQLWNKSLEKQELLYVTLIHSLTHGRLLLWQRGEQRILSTVKAPQLFYYYLNPHLFQFFAQKKLP